MTPDDFYIERDKILAELPEEFREVARELSAGVDSLSETEPLLHTHFLMSLRFVVDNLKIPIAEFRKNTVTRFNREARAKEPSQSANLYVALSHGRDSTNEILSDRGFHGPVIGPVGINTTYGTIKLHRPDWNDFEELRYKDGCVEYCGKFYGDFDILPAGNPCIVGAAAESNEPIHTWDVFAANMRAPRPPVTSHRPVAPLPLP